MLDPVVLVGAGRAGRALSAALRAAGLPHALVDRDRIVEQHGPPVFTVRAQAIASARVILVAVRDGQLDVALDELRERQTIRPGVVALQVNGSAEPAARVRLSATGVPYGTFHPLLPLLDPMLASFRLQGSVVGIEGDAVATATASALAARLGATTIVIPRDDRAAYHAAAVMASNFPVALAALAEGLLSRIGVDSIAAHRGFADALAAHLGRECLAQTAQHVIAGKQREIRRCRSEHRRTLALRNR